MKKRLVIIFPHEWVAYSPTILNIVEMLSASHEVRVFAIDSGGYRADALDPRVFTMLHVYWWLRLMLGACGLYGVAKAFLLYRATRRCEADEVIGVDSIGLYVAQKRYGSAHFLSLEIQRDWFLRHLRRECIHSIAIQSRERLDFLFQDMVFSEVFFIPNSPITSRKEPAISGDGSHRIVFLGNIIPSHGIFLCIDAVTAIPGVVLTIKGTIRPAMRRRLMMNYSTLFAEGRVILDDSYTPQDEIVGFLRGYELGFCFYDFRFIANGNVNYITSPSGKMYNYFAAGVPVIGSDIPGLKAVKEYEAGILLSDVSTAAVVNAIHAVRNDLESYRQGCRRAAKALDFADCAKPYLSFVVREADSK